MFLLSDKISGRISVVTPQRIHNCLCLVQACVLWWCYSSQCPKFRITGDTSPGHRKRGSSAYWVLISKHPHGIRMYIGNKNTNGCYIIGIIWALSYFILERSKILGRGRKRNMLIVWRTATKWWPLTSLYRPDDHLCEARPLTRLSRCYLCGGRG